MPSTFTNNGGIELPADGEKDGVWGDVVNLNMQIVDRLTNGVGAVSLTGTTHTLTTANGVLSDGQYGLIVFGGSPSGTNTVTISPNDAEKVYFVRNATAQSVIMTQGSGGNVTIPAGTGAIVYANGAGTGAAVADLTATFVPDLALAGVTATPAELNLLAGVPLTTDLSYVDGVTSAIQTQIDSKQATVTGAATTIVSDDLTTSRALVSDGSGKVAVSDVTADELSRVSGVTSAIQTQIDGKQAGSDLLSSITALPNIGLVVNTGEGVATTRSIQGGTGISVSNGGGANGAPTISANLASQAEAEAGTDNTKVMTPLRVAQAVSSIRTEYMHVEDQKPSGTSGGGASGLVTRTLNTVVANTIAGASLASNAVTLPAGTYRINASAPVNEAGTARLYLYNLSDAVNIASGPNVNMGTVDGQGNVTSLIAIFTLAATKDLTLRQRINAFQSDGLGQDVNDGEPEIYAQAFIERLA